MIKFFSFLALLCLSFLSPEANSGLLFWKNKKAAEASKMGGVSVKETERRFLFWSSKKTVVTVNGADSEEVEGSEGLEEERYEEDGQADLSFPAPVPLKASATASPMSIPEKTNEKDIAFKKSPTAARLMVVDGGFDLRSPSLSQALDWEAYTASSPEGSLRERNYEVMDQVIENAPANYEEIRPLTSKIGELKLELTKASAIPSEELMSTEVFEVDPCQRSSSEIAYEIESFTQDNAKVLEGAMDKNALRRLRNLDHGTHVASIAVAGIEDKVKLLPVALKFNDNSDVGFSDANLLKKCFQKNNEKACRLIDQALGKDLAVIEDAIKKGSPDVVNMSFGSTKVEAFKGSFMAKLTAGGDKKIQEMMGELIKRFNKARLEMMKRYPQTNFVVAAGNDKEEIFRGSEDLEVPPNVVVVGSVGKDKKISSFSNISSRSHKVDIFALGENVEGNVYDSPKKYKISGTSQGAPQVSRALALIKEKYPSISAVERKEMLLKNYAITDNVPGRSPSSEEIKILAAEVFN